jgi:hypothetical protein
MSIKCVDNVDEFVGCESAIADELCMCCMWLRVRDSGRATYIVCLCHFVCQKSRDLCQKSRDLCQQERQCVSFLRRFCVKLIEFCSRKFVSIDNKCSEVCVNYFYFLICKRNIYLHDRKFVCILVEFTRIINFINYY